MCGVSLATEENRVYPVLFLRRSRNIISDCIDCYYKLLAIMADKSFLSSLCFVL